MSASDILDEEAARAARAVARGARLTARVLQLGEEELATPDGTPASRIELLVELTRAAWAVTGEPWPNLPRSLWPVRIRNLGDPE